jgi:hypothetical protein
MAASRRIVATACRGIRRHNGIPHRRTAAPDGVLSDLSSASQDGRPQRKRFISAKEIAPNVPMPPIAHEIESADFVDPLPPDHNLTNQIAAAFRGQEVGMKP